MQSLNRLLFALATVAAIAAAVILVVQPVWISYGVFTRYVLDSPDRTVTEATAILLIPLAFLGLPLAFRSNALPKVTFLEDALSPGWRSVLRSFNLLVMSLIGAFLSYMTLLAAIKAFQFGTRSDVLRWPEYPIWFSLAFALILFTLLAFREFVISAAASRKPQGRS